jgi:hypothetical protein
LVNIPYFRKISISLASSTAIALLLLASPLALSNLLLLQPAQAQTLMSFRTAGQASGTDENSGEAVGLTFDAHGTSSTSNPSSIDITNGTIQLMADPPNGQTYNGEITEGSFRNSTSGGEISFFAKIDNTDYTGSSDCSSADNNYISLSNQYGRTDFQGPVECGRSQGGGGDTTATRVTQPSSSMTTGTTTTQDSDSDGIPDSSDRCPNNSQHRCFKEGDTSTTTTTTHEQQPSSPSSSSSNRTGNQTR